MAKKVLNAGAGPKAAARLHPAFDSARWSETSLDVDPEVNPDLVGTFVDMTSIVADGDFDAIYSSHAIEHLHAHQVIPAFREFRRVLKSDGFALLTCPDLSAIARFLLRDGAETVAYNSPAGPIRPIDMIYGHGASIANGRYAMCHNTGFTAPRLARIALVSGFAEVRVIQGDTFDLWALLLGPEALLEDIRPMFDATPLEALFGKTADAIANQSAAHSPAAG
jgi:SAM-dependent methyltransferase